jgi:heme/copper-type cytochrome/quinol oxidase subunit 1
MAILLVLAILCNVLLLSLYWIDHMFVSGLNPFLGAVLSLFFLLLAIPVAIFALKRLVRYAKGKPGVSPATLFLLGSFFFLTGDFIDPLRLGNSTLDIQLNDTYFVIAHAHVIFFLTLIFLGFSAIYFFYPRLTRRTLNAPMGYIHFGFTIVGVYLLYWQVHYIGLAGMPGRYLDYSDGVNLGRFDRINDFKMKVTILLIGAQLLFMLNLIYSAVRGKKGGPGLYFWGLVTLLSSLPACQKANSTPPPITATFGSTNFQSTTYSNTYSESTGTFTINTDMTTVADSSSLLLRFQSPFQLNVPFNSDTALTTTIIYTTNKGLNNYIAGLDDAFGHCVMTITAWDSTQHTIAGTFSGETINNSNSADSLSMTNGKFNTTYTTTN